MPNIMCTSKTNSSSRCVRPIKMCKIELGRHSFRGFWEQIGKGPDSLQFFLDAESLLSHATIHSLLGKEPASVSLLLFHCFRGLKARLERAGAWQSTRLHTGIILQSAGTCNSSKANDFAALIPFWRITIFLSESGARMRWLFDFRKPESKIHLNTSLSMD